MADWKLWSHGFPVNLRSAIHPGEVALAVGSWFRSGIAGVGLLCGVRLLLDVGSVRKRCFLDGVLELLVRPSSPDHQDHARAGAGADEDVLGPRRAVHKVPLPEPPLLSLDDEQAFPGEDEKILLGAFAVVHAVGLAGLEDADVQPDVLKTWLALEDARAAELVTFEPRGIAGIEDEPALPLGDEACVGA